MGNAKEHEKKKKKKKNQMNKCKRRWMIFGMKGGDG